MEIFLFKLASAWFNETSMWLSISELVNSWERNYLVWTEYGQF